MCNTQTLSITPEFIEMNNTLVHAASDFDKIKKSIQSQYGNYNENGMMGSFSDLWKAVKEFETQLNLSGNTMFSKLKNQATVQAA